ncbi:MAG TPA: transketolase [Clostridia bacterium]|nr:transketolase [Clostridia bacterium]
MVDAPDQKLIAQKAYAIRRHIVRTIASNGEGHAGGALSAADIIATLYFGVMDTKASDVRLQDKFILSAGHKCLALYGALVEKGVLDEAAFATYNELGAMLAGHPDATKIPAVNFSTGSLGHGLPLGCGYALAAKLCGLSYATYVLMGDGEQGEGSNWEAASIAAQHKLDNLVAVLDENGLQINGRTERVSKATPFEARYAAFGWNVYTVDGHDIGALCQVFEQATKRNEKPTLIVARTVKGKGLGFMEDKAAYHHWIPNKEQAATAVAEIDAYGKEKGYI